MNKVFKAFKHAFIPHKHNDYKPHFFREFSIAVLLVIALGLFAVSVSSALVIDKTEAGARIVVKVLIDLTNDNRIANNLRALIHNPQLDQAAQLKADDMVRGGYFSHYSPSGVTPWYWFGRVGYYFLYAGENLAVNFSESEAVENAWMKSPLHRANILDNRFEEIGIATSLGAYEGNNTTFVVQLFGTPAFAESATKESTSGESGGVTSEVNKKLNTTSSVVQSSIDTSNTKPRAKLSVATTTPTAQAAVEGASTEVANVTKPVTKSLVDTQSLVAVENVGAQATNKGGTADVSATVPTYSMWYEKLLYSSPTLVSSLYIMLISMISIALCLFIFIEIKRQHPKHIAYGVLMLTIFSVLFYLNQTQVVTLIPKLVF
jgi:uncharacterized protein YkwD